MKVKIGNYIHRWSTSGLEDLWFRMRYGKDKNRWSIEEEDYDRWDRLFDRFSCKLQSVLNATVNPIVDRRKRTVRVKVDYYDVWSADHTLALVILPVLQKLKSVKHGSACVDVEDVPENLRPTEPSGPNNGYTDNTVHERWDWVLNEMIWAFEQIVDEDSEDKFYDHTESDKFNAENPDQFLASLDKIKVDRDGLAAHHARIKRGTTLFGKYYRGLWD